jgi:acetate---CoA ligase (ADP-forming)
MDELATALIMFAQPHPVAAGGLVSIHDSGGERQLIIDLADRAGVALAEVSAATERRLADLLDPGLLPVNPLDAWSKGGPDYHLVMEQCFATLMADEQAAFGAVVHDRAPNGAIYPAYIAYLKAGHAASGKPVFLVANHQGTGSDPLVAATTREGFPVLDGLSSFLTGARCLLNYRDFRHRWQAGETIDSGNTTDARVVTSWAERLAEGATLDEFESGRLLADFGITVNAAQRVQDETSAVRAATELGYPVVLKSAQPGLLHKTDQGGVRLNLRTEAELRAAYREMSGRLGPSALLSRMVTGTGVEMMLGVVRDEQFGPLVLMGFGGIHVETLHDVVCALPPFTAATARRLLSGLQQRQLLEAHRGAPAVDIDAFCTAAASLSRLAATLGEAVGEIDVNPVLVQPKGCLALDALVVGRHVADNWGQSKVPE